MIAAPRDGQNTIGVAWKANLVSIRAVEDPLVITASGPVREAIEIAADPNQFGSDIVNLSLGSPFHYDSIEDEIEFWHEQHDVLFFAAAGTST